MFWSLFFLGAKSRFFLILAIKAAAGVLHQNQNKAALNGKFL